MGIAMLRQNRWVALLVGALFVSLSLSLINLLGVQTNASEEEKTLPAAEMVAESAPEAGANVTGKATFHNMDRGFPVLFSSNQFHKWNPNEQEAGLSFPVPGIKGNDFKAGAKIGDSESKPQSAAKSDTADMARPEEPKKPKGTTVLKTQAKSLQPPTTLFFTRTKLLTQDQKAQATWEYALSAEELLLLRKIVMAEAEGEPYEGKVAVANVVLNRLRSANFPNTIKDVIYQKHQFSPVANGRLRRVQPSKETIKAVNAALHGHKAVKDDTYFFLSLTLAQDLTVHHSRTFAKKIGNHSFYK